MPTILSYTTLSNYEKNHHTYLNKIFGVKTIETDAMREGKRVHKLIQNHFLGIAKIPKLSTCPFDFDKAEYHARKPYSDDFLFHGFLDMVNFRMKSFLEIKTVTETLWTLGKFQNLMQWKYYSWVTNFPYVKFITSDFSLENIKYFTSEATQKDLEEAENWAMTQLEGIKSGKFKDDLIDGKCHGCAYSTNCLFL